MSDAPTFAEATRGHNSGTFDLSLALDPTQLLADLQASTADLHGRSEEMTAAYDRFAAATKDGIPSDDVLARAGDFVRQLSAHLANVDARRTAVKAPVLTAQRTIDNFFKRDLADPIDAAKTRVVRAIEDYQRRQREAAAARQREEAARAQAEAERLAAEAERARQAVGDGAADTIMEAAIEAEARAEAVAAAPVTAGPVRTDFGTSVGTRLGPWKVRVTDISKVPTQFLMANEPVLLATAKTDARIAAGQQPIPGVEFYRETKASIR